MKPRTVSQKGSKMVRDHQDDREAAQRVDHRYSYCGWRSCVQLAFGGPGRARRAVNARFISPGH
jgi:hypothetical protein